MSALLQIYDSFLDCTGHVLQKTKNIFYPKQVAHQKSVKLSGIGQAGCNSGLLLIFEKKLSYELCGRRDIVLFIILRKLWTSQVALVVKNLPANAGDIRGTGAIPGLGRSPGEGNCNPLQYPCLVNPMDKGAWQAIVHGIVKSRTRLKRLSTHSTHKETFVTQGVHRSQESSKKKKN